MKIFIANLPPLVKATDIRKWFSSFGPVRAARTITAKDTDQSWGFAFLEMPDIEQGCRAIAGLDGALVGGQKIVVKLAGNQRPFRRGGKRPRMTLVYGKTDQQHKDVRAEAH
jgi:RNA recognition motif-containing protein